MGDFSRAWKRELDRAERQAGRDLGKFVGGIGAQVTREFGAQGEYNLRNARAYQQQAGRIGAMNGRNEAFANFNGAQASYNNGYVNGVRGGANQLGNRDGRAAVYGANQGYQDPSVQLIRTHNGNGRMDDAFLIDNQGYVIGDPNLLAQSLYRLDRNKGDAAQNLANAFNAGLHPDAVMQDQHGRNNGEVYTLEQYLHEEVRNDEERNAALGVLNDYRAQYHQAAAVSSVAQQLGAAPAGVANGQVQAPNPQQLAQAQPQFSGVGAYVETASISEKLDILVNREQVAGMNAAQRLQTLKTVVQGIKTPAEAQEFNQFVATNPTYAANLVTLINTSGLSVQELQQTAQQMGVAATKIKELDPQGVAAAERAAQNTPTGQQAQEAARERRANLSVDELEKVRISDQALQQELQTAIANERDWQSQVKDAGFFGFILQIFRPFLDDNPTPNEILAEAARTEGVTIAAGTKDIETKLENRLGAGSENKVVLNEALMQDAETVAQAEGQAEGQEQKPAAEQAVASNEQEQEAKKEQALETQQAVAAAAVQPSQQSEVAAAEANKADMGIGENGVPNALNPNAQQPALAQQNGLDCLLDGINLGAIGVSGDGACINNTELGNMNQVASNQTQQRDKDAQVVGS